MAVIETWLRQDLKELVKVKCLTGNLFSLDNGGNLIGVEVYDNGTPADISGTVTANVIRADGTYVAVPGGTLSGNRASVILPQSCYAVTGNLTVAIKLTDSGTVTTIACVTGVVYMSSTDTPVDPGTIMPDIQTLIEQIQTAVESIPADYSSLWTTLAPAYSTSATFVIGAYSTYNGKLYRCISTISSGESWNPAHWTEAKIGPDLSRQNNALMLQEETIPDTTQTIVFDSSGNVSSILHKDANDNTIRSDAFSFAGNTITEVRTLYTGETLTIVTNTDTLITTATYA